MTVLGSVTAGMLGGVFTIEIVFGWRGVGWYASSAILAADYFATISITLVIAITVTVANLLTDLAYGIIDPRIRYS
jgi:peptide/nickel transport system permease protein